MYLLQDLLVLLLLVHLLLCQYQISFDPHSSPPLSIPVNPKDYVYSVPLNQMVSKPILIYVEFTNGSRVTNGPLSSAVYEVSSVDINTVYSTNFNDTWMTGAKLCQKSAWWLNYPQRYNRDLHKVRCGSNVSLTALEVQAFNGIIILDWVYHEHRYPPPNKRMFIVRHHPKRLIAYSNPFLITHAADHLEITQQPPLSVIANHDFTVVAEVKYENGSTVDTGLDSVAYIELGVPYYFKTFANTRYRRMILKKSLYRLSGKDLILNQGNYDWVIRKQAVKGRAIFDAVRILEPVKKIKLNLTMTMIRDPWLRVPICNMCYADLGLISRNNDSTEITFRKPDALLLKKLKPIALTQEFEVKPQSLSKLRFTNATLETFRSLKDPTSQLIRLTRNSQLPGTVAIEATDSVDARIYAGPESTFTLIYQTIPSSVCISSDTTTKMLGGYINLFFSICQIIKNVSLEIVPSIQWNTSIRTPFFEVVGVLNVAHVGDFRFSGDGAQLESHTNSFIKYAANDINQGYMLPFLSRHGFFINISTYETKSKTSMAYEAMELIGQKRYTKDKIGMIISSTTQQIAQVFNTKLRQLNSAFISTSNTENSFSDKRHYELFNRVCWSEQEILKSVWQACKDRMWVELIIVKQKQVILNDIFYRLLHEKQITIQDIIDIDVSSVIKGEPAFFKIEMDRIKKFNHKVILLLASRAYQPYILHAAYLANLDALHGYQWILYSIYAWQFPFANEAVCQLGMPCTKAFKSTFLFSETYNISGYHTSDWIRVLGYHFSVDRFYYKGGRVKYRPPEVGAKMALGYDALLLYATAIQEIVSMRETLHSIKIAKLSRNIDVNGLTGTFRLDSNGDRIGYFGFLAQVNPFDENKAEASISMMVTFTRILKSNPDGSQLEIPYKASRPNTDPQNPKSKPVLPKSQKFNTRIYHSVSGVVNQLTQQVTLNPSEPWPSIPYTRKELVVPRYFCSQRCGRDLLSGKDVNVYDTGVCKENGMCACNAGFHGNSCTIVICKCKHGRCLSPTHCLCFSGWRGLECNLPICKECVHGDCIKPDKCDCNSVYFGETCDYHVSVVLGPLLAGGLIIAIILGLLAKYLIKHAERNAALADIAWIIKWKDVTALKMDEPILGNSSDSILTRYIAQNINTFQWKEEKWYAKQLNSLNIDGTIPQIRLEMFELTKKISHRNLIKYVGASLTKPNIYLFQEVAEKGSLNDILLNESIDLGWDFKYSFIRDIFEGMRYLHDKTMIISHGRLTSYNCLIDNRWTIRISGYGAPTIRFGRFRMPPEEKEAVRYLFWSAPELVRNASCRDDIKNGTPTGDVYSAAMVISEIITRLEPYEYEQYYVSEEFILDMICNFEESKSNPSRKIWEELGGSKMLHFRPIIKDEFLPESINETKQILKMLDEAWLENPSGRPTFEYLIKKLRHIHPVKRDLIDNLINLLETYSTNLEILVFERTQELESHQNRAEQLLGQMLPKKVALQMQNGQPILPEYFSSATVLFSDIADFSKICNESSPMQIVDFLNETYCAFDDILNYYDVYKVDTICDSYMVVSGAPEKNGIQHADAITTTALHLMSTVTTFQIPHKPKLTLQLRIGIHTGPVVAGVLGVVMPKYSLLGDTINIASLMETTSLPLCIQASEKTVELLIEIGGFELEYRGKKGQDKMITYWVWGKDNFEMPMPDRSSEDTLERK